MNRTGVAGSAAGALVLGALLLRSSMPAPVAPALPRGGERRISSTAPRSTKATKAPKTKSSKSKAGVYPEEGPWKASQQHFAGAGPEGCPPQDASGDKKRIASLGGVNLLLQQDQRWETFSNPRKQVWCIPDDQRVQAMIAIAPDPAHTNLALMFDRAVEAVQLAAQSGYYLADRYWLPWDVSLTKDWADYASAQQAITDQEETEEEPGLLLFRWNGDQPAPRDKPAVLYVFLVADTSTAGINGAQFSNALDYLEQVCSTGGGAAGCLESTTVHIIGPTFSGSLDSLTRLIRADSRRRVIRHQARRSFSVYSGTISSEANVNRQRSAFAELGIKFQSLVSDTQSAFIKLIVQLHGDKDISCVGKPEVAILSETETAFGVTIVETKAHPCYTEFVYPREIASLRNAYQTVGPQTGAAAAGTPGTSSPYLSLNLADQTNRSDEPPDFSSPQGPLSKEAVLMSYAAEMRRDHYKYIGVSATNILDALFLANFLRKAVPDARLFIFDSDLLFERELDNAPYLGTLAVSTYPLILRDLDWTKPGLKRLPFADQYEQGQYNAGILAIRSMLNYPPAQLPTYECGEQPSDKPLAFGEACSQLPLWLVAVGTGGYWPVQRLQTTYDSLPPGSPTSLGKEDFSTAWKTACTLLCLLAALQSWVLLRASPIATHFREFALGGAVPTQKLVVINFGSASLALGLALMVMPACLGRDPGYAVTAIAIVVPLSIVLLLAVCAVLYSFVSRRFKREPGARYTPPLGVAAFLSVLAWVGALGAAVVWWRLIHNSQGDYGVFFAYRAVQLASVLSPALPILILLAVVYLWSVSEVWRLRFNELSRPKLKVKGGFPGGIVAKRSSEADTSAAIRKLRLKNSYLIGFIWTFLLWLFAVDILHPFQLFERPWFGRLYEVLLCVAVFVMLWKGFRLGQIWSELKRLLFELERSPLRFAFARLQGFTWSPIWRQGGQEAEWVFMARSIGLIGHLGDCNGNVDWTLEPFHAPAEENLARVCEELKAIVTSFNAGADRTKLQSRLANARSELKVINAKVGGADACKSSCCQAVMRLLAAVESILSLPDAKASIDTRVGEILGIVEQLRESSRKDPFLGLKGGAARFDEKFHALQESLADALGHALDILLFHWSLQAGTDEDSGERNDEDKDKQVVVYCKSEDDPKPGVARVRLLEEFAALRYVSFIREVLAHLRHSLIFLAVSFSLVLISLNVYSFEPHQSLIWSFTAIFVVIGFITVVVLVQVHRDHVLNRITGTQPNEVGLAFYVRIVSLGALPLLTLLTTHFPSIGRYLVSFLQPGLEALK
jgi:hypothetical protein